MRSCRGFRAGLNGRIGRLYRFMIYKKANFRIHTKVGFFTKTGAPERIRTSDLSLRRAALYPAELRAQNRKRILNESHINYD